MMVLKFSLDYNSQKVDNSQNVLNQHTKPLLEKTFNYKKRSYDKSISIMRTNETHKCIILLKLTNKRRQAILRTFPKTLLSTAMALL